MKSSLFVSLILIASSAHASFVCTSHETNEQGKPVWNLHVHETENSAQTKIDIWQTGHETSADHFECLRFSSYYQGGRNSEYGCNRSNNRNLRAYSQITGDNIQASAVLRSDDEEIGLSNMDCFKAD